MHLQMTSALLAAVVAAALQGQTTFSQTNNAVSSQATTGRASGAYRVSSFSVEGRWLGAFPLPLREGELWTAEKQFEVLEAIRGAFSNESSLTYLLNQAGEIGVFYVDVKEEKNEENHTVKLTFRPLQVRLSLTRLGDNVLPVPRSPLPTRYQAVPAPLLALQPTFGVTYDRAFGTAIEGAVQNDLLTLPDTFHGRVPVPGDEHLDARFSGAKAFDEFYRADAGLEYSLRRLGNWLQELSLSGDYDGTREPLAEQEHTHNSGGAAAGMRLRVAGHTRLAFTIGLRYAEDLLEEGAIRTRTSTEVQPNRVVAESLLPRPVGGFVRGAVWEDNGWTDESFGSHQRLVARFGYAREFAIAPNQTIGLELLSGGGTLWGDAPPSRRFFGGNTTSQFLYDPLTAPSLVAMPVGPLIRSFGQGQAVGSGSGGAIGGDSFWHVNLNLTFPLRALSFPLIPQEEEVRDMLKNGINVSGRNFLISSLKQQGMSREEAVAEADRTLNEIRPATEFIIDEANLYAVKPLLMFDAGGLAGAGQDATWTAVGGGVQLTIVNARLEVGYMHTLTGPTSGSHGAFYLRLVFQNLF